MGEAFVDPEAAGVDPDVGEGVGERGCERSGVGGGCGPGQIGDQQGVVFEGLAGAVEDGESGEGVRAEPIGEEGLDQGGGRVIGGERLVVGGNGGEEAGVGLGADVGGGVAGDEEAGHAEADGLGIEGGGGDAGGFGDGEVGVVADGEELLALAAEEGGVGWLADVLNGEAEADGGGGLAQADAADGLE